ncbi:MAG: hypothetical protein PHR26_04020 [Candidatus ainarchaeum sp.]|nr:hypothetical protein [Candidatus ainarchaeum sp.]MDD3975619.1 hypothetical protein [Candidatus ainarchaeum sp.]
MKENGFAYIFVAVIIIMLITAMLLLEKPIYIKEYKINHLIENYKSEITYFLENDFNEEDLNNFNYNFYNFIKSHNYKIKLCTIINSDKIYLSNYLGEEDIQIGNKNTISLAKQEKDYNILNKCDLDYNSYQNISYYIEIYNTEEKIIEKN